MPSILAQCQLQITSIRNRNLQTVIHSSMKFFHVIADILVSYHPIRNFVHHLPLQPTIVLCFCPQAVARCCDRRRCFFLARNRQSGLCYQGHLQFACHLNWLAISNFSGCSSLLSSSGATGMVPINRQILPRRVHSVRFDGTEQFINGALS